MSSGGAPTGKWETFPTHLQGKPEDPNLRRAGVRLTVRRPGAPPIEIEIDKSEFVIGRDASAVDLVVDDDLVSRRHAKLSMDDRGYFQLADLGSRNGIKFMNRVVRRLNLVDGDAFAIGRAEFVFHAKMNRFDSKAPARPSEPPPGRHEPADPAEAPEDSSDERLAQGSSLEPPRRR